VAQVTVFGAGAMGTALAMHLAREGRQTALWASPFDAAVLAALTQERKHPGLPEHLPESLAVLGPDDLAAAAKDLEMAVMGANSAGARTLARLVVEGCGAPARLVSVAKGLEPETYLRMSEVYTVEAGHGRVVSVGGPCLAPEVAQGLPSSVVFAAADPADAEAAAAVFRSKDFHVAVTDDVVGVEYCTVAKNVAAIGVGIVDGLAKVTGMEYRNAKSALFSQAFLELERLVVALGGRVETARGLAGLGDVLVTSLGGRNRLYGEMVGEGGEPAAALKELTDRGMTVEGVESTVDVRRLAADTDLRLPLFAQVHAILFDGAPAQSVLDCLKG
jgi:glycerol-3-phosphate dehydrogenase (NAD(P)+)